VVDGKLVAVGAVKRAAKRCQEWPIGGRWQSLLPASARRGSYQWGESRRDGATGGSTQRHSPVDQGHGTIAAQGNATSPLIRLQFPRRDSPAYHLSSDQCAWSPRTCVSTPSSKPAAPGRQSLLQGPSAPTRRSSSRSRARAWLPGDPRRGGNAVGVIAERGADGELQHARQHGLVH